VVLHRLDFLEVRCVSLHLDDIKIHVYEVQSQRIERLTVVIAVL